MKQEEEKCESCGLHGFRLSRLEESLQEVWHFVRGHNQWITEINIAYKVVKVGVVVVVSILLFLLVLMKFGPEKLLEWWVS